MKLTDKFSTYEFFPVVFKKAWIFHVLACRAVQCKYHILTTCENSFETKMDQAAWKQFNSLLCYLKEPAENWPFPCWNWFEVPFYGILCYENSHLGCAWYNIKDTVVKASHCKSHQLPHITPSGLHWVHTSCIFNYLRHSAVKECVQIRGGHMISLKIHTQDKD